MKTLLCVDTASFALHFALYEDLDEDLHDADSKRLLFQHQTAVAQQWTHSALLVPLLEKAIQESETDVQDLSAICVNVGPGSFTGLRASLSMVRALGQFLPNLKIVPVTGFQMHLARLLNETPNILDCQAIAIALDARRQQQYMAYFTQNNSGKWTTQAQGLFSDEAVFAQLADSTLYYADTACLARYAGNSPTHLLEAQNAKMTDALWRAVILFDIEAVAWHALDALYLQEPHITPNPNPPKAFNLGG